MTQLEKKTRDDPVVCSACGAACDAEDTECQECGARLKTQETDGFKEGIC